MRWLAATISLNVSAILPSMPSAVAGHAHREVADAHRLERGEQVVVKYAGGNWYLREAVETIFLLACNLSFSLHCSPKPPSAV